jgi:outer membrane immunogenic protein
MKLTALSAAMLALAAVAGAASAEDSGATGQRSWEGFYAGGNIGGAFSTTCNTWEPDNVIKGTPPLANAFYNRNCPNNSTFIGGLQFGYNFQVHRIVWGLDFDYDGWATNKHNRSYTYVGATPPPNGTYTFNGNVSPSGFGLIHPRIGYVIDDWLPYFTAGTIIAGGSHNSTAAFTPVGGSAPATSFSGGKNFTSTGWIVGVGAEYALSGPWSFKAEYLYANLGKSKNTTTTCTASASACAAFSNFSLDNIHNSFTANLFRVGINYRFGGKPAAPAAAPPPPPPPLPPPPRGEPRG